MRSDRRLALRQLALSGTAEVWVWHNRDLRVAQLPQAPRGASFTPGRRHQNLRQVVGVITATTFDNNGNDDSATVVDVVVVVVCFSRF